MKRMLPACGLLVLGSLGCINPEVAKLGFGPYPSSSFGGGWLTAGVAGFIPGMVPQEGEFLLVIVNTDSQSSHTVVVTPEGDIPLTRTIGPCSAGNVAVSCTAPAILVEITGTTADVPPALTFTPDPDNCVQKVIYIETVISLDPGNDTDAPAEPPSLTEELPPSIVNCQVTDQTLAP